MHELFTFLDNPYLVILGESLKTLPGIERVDLLFYNTGNAKTELHSIQRTKHSQQAVQLEFSNNSLDTLNAFSILEILRNLLNITGRVFLLQEKLILNRLYLLLYIM